MNVTPNKPPPGKVTPENFIKIQTKLLNEGGWILTYEPFFQQKGYEIFLITNPILSNNVGYYIETLDPKYKKNILYYLRKRPIGDISSAPAVTPLNNLEIGDYIFSTQNNIYIWRKKLYFDDCNIAIYIPYPHQQLGNVFRRVLKDITKKFLNMNQNTDFGNDPIEKIIEHIMEDLKIEEEANNIESLLVSH